MNRCFEQVEDLVIVFIVARLCMIRRSCQDLQEISTLRREVVYSGLQLAYLRSSFLVLQ